MGRDAYVYTLLSERNRQLYEGGGSISICNMKIFLLFCWVSVVSASLWNNGHFCGCSMAAKGLGIISRVDINWPNSSVCTMWGCTGNTDINCKCVYYYPRYVERLNVEEKFGVEAPDNGENTTGYLIREIYVSKCPENIQDYVSSNLIVTIGTGYVDVGGVDVSVEGLTHMRRPQDDVDIDEYLTMEEMHYFVKLCPGIDRVLLLVEQKYTRVDKTFQLLDVPSPFNKIPKRGGNGTLIIEGKTYAESADSVIADMLDFLVGDWLRVFFFISLCVLIVLLNEYYCDTKLPEIVQPPSDGDENTQNTQQHSNMCVCQSCACLC